jgi:periplasmic divalent cation tolerance protein
MLVVFTTTPTADEAESLAEKLVDARLAACVQIVHGIRSVYMWKGAVHKDEEHLLVIKTLEEHWENLQQFISVHHSYSVPEIVALDSDRVSDTYLQWIEGMLRTD